MKIVKKDASPSGAYSAIHSWAGAAIPPSHALWPDTLDVAIFYEYNGFVLLTIKEEEGVDTVVSYTPNVEAWEKWKASLPEPSEPEPTQLDILEAQATYTAMMTGTLLEV